MKRLSSTASTMTSDEDDCVTPKSTEAPRRSKRLARSDPTYPAPKLPKTTDDRTKKKSSAPKIKSTHGKQFDYNKIPKEERSTNEFSNSYLTAAELQQLFIKFKRDGHFRLTKRNVSPPPLVISRTTDGKCMTTKIECYKTNPQLVRDLTTNFAASRSNTKTCVEINEPTSVTFSTPLSENTSGISLPTATMTPSTFVSPMNKFVVPTIATNCPQKPSSYPPLNQRRTFGAGNGFFENPTPSNRYQKSISTSAAENLQANGFATSSGPSGFCFANTTNQNLSSRSHGILDNPRNPQTRGIYPQNVTNVYDNNNPTDHVNNFNRSNSKIIPHSNVVEIPNYRYENYSNYDVFGYQNVSQRPKNIYQRNKNVTMNDSSFDRFDKWNLPIQTISNSFGTNPTTIKTHAMSDDPLNCNSSRILGYNSDYTNVNDCLYNVQTNSRNSSIDQNTGYHHQSIANWNNVSSLTNSLHCNVYQDYGKCETATRPLINDQSRIPSVTKQMNSWSMIEETEKNIFNIDGLATNDSTSKGSNNFQSIANIVENKNLPETRNIVETEILSSNEERNDDAGFNFQQLPDSQNSGLCPTVSSSCSFDDDISYDNYMSDNIICDDDNLKSTITENLFQTRELPNVMSIKTEMRSWYDDNNCYGNNVRSIGCGNSGINDFDTKKEMIDSSDCFIIDNASKS